MTREEAIKVANEMYGWVRTDREREALETLVPELRESEDERIRKEILDWMKGGNTYDWQNNKDKWIDYLERLKEENHDGKKWIYEDEYHKDMERSFNDGKDEVLENPEKYGLQKEQKPEIKYVYPAFKVGDIIKPKAYNESHRINEIKDDNYVLDNGFTFPIVGQDVWEIVEQKPTDYCSLRDEFDLDGNLKQKPNYCHYGGDPSVERCKYCSASCSARLVEERYSPLCKTVKDKIVEYISNHFITDSVVKTDVRAIVKAMEEGVRLGKEEEEREV